MIKTNIKINGTSFFKEMQKRASLEMEEKKIDAILIPNAFGYYLVRPFTKEAEKREKDKTIVYKTIIEGREYLICMS